MATTTSALLAFAKRPLLIRWTAPFQRHRNVPIRNIYGPTASYILAFAERPLLANNGRERAFRLRPLLPR